MCSEHQVGTGTKWWGAKRVSDIPAEHQIYSHQEFILFNCHLISFPLIYSMELFIFWNTYKDECKGGNMVHKRKGHSLLWLRPPSFYSDPLCLCFCWICERCSCLPAETAWYSITLCLIAHQSDHSMWHINYFLNSLSWTRLESMMKMTYCIQPCIACI